MSEPKSNFDLDTSAAFKHLMATINDIRNTAERVPVPGRMSVSLLNADEADDGWDEELGEDLGEFDTTYFRDDLDSPDCVDAVIDDLEDMDKDYSSAKMSFIVELSDTSPGNTSDLAIMLDNIVAGLASAVGADFDIDDIDLELQQ